MQDNSNRDKKVYLHLMLYIDKYNVQTASKIENGDGGDEVNIN